MEKPLISVIVAIYNVEDYLDKCIESICRQEYYRLQIILVDDGSTDTSGELCEKWKNQDRRIVIIHQLNKGLVNARRAGLERADGELVLFVDGDDYLELDMIATLYETMQLSDADIVNCGFFQSEHIIAAPDCFYKVTDLNRQQFMKDCIFDLNSPKRILSSIWSKLFKLSVIKEAYLQVPEECSVGEDLLAWIYCSLQDVSVCSIGNPLYHYVKRDSSMMNKIDRFYYKRRLPFLCEIDRIMRTLKCDDNLCELVDIYIKQELIGALRKSILVPFALKQYTLKKSEDYENKRIALYGAGNVGRDLFTELERIKGCKICVWVDKNAELMQGDIPVQRVERLLDEEYDLVVLAINDSKTAQRISDDLERMGISADKIKVAETTLVH